MTLLKDNNYKDINVALLSLEADIKNKIAGFDTSEIDKQLTEINNRIDKINAGGNNTSAVINDIRYEIEDINTKLNGNSAKIQDIEQKLSDIFSAENKVTDFNTTTNSGIYYWIDDAANRPCDYGVLLVNKYDSGDNSLWINQIAYGTNNKIYFRQNINSGNWTEWKAVAFEGEVTAYKVANALTVNGKTYDGSSAVNAGVQTVANGGTGVTTQAEINKAFIGNLGVGGSDVTDGTEFVSSWTSDAGFADPSGLNIPFKRQFIKVWNYIKNKISSVLGLTKDNYGGKASTAGTADKAVEVVDYNSTSKTVKIGYQGPSVTADKLLYLAGYTEPDVSSVKIKDVGRSELIKWLGIPRIKYADYTIPTQTYSLFQQVPIELSKFSSEVTRKNVLSFMVIWWSGVKLIASADYENPSSPDLKCALIALGSGSGTATIRCVYMV